MSDTHRFITEVHRRQACGSTPFRPSSRRLPHPHPLRHIEHDANSSDSLAVELTPAIFVPIVGMTRYSVRGRKGQLPTRWKRRTDETVMDAHIPADGMVLWKRCRGIFPPFPSCLLTHPDFFFLPFSPTHLLICFYTPISVSPHVAMYITQFDGYKSNFIHTMWMLDKELKYSIVRHSRELCRLLL